MPGVCATRLWLWLLVLVGLLRRSALAQELVSDGDFATHPNRVTAGQYMSEFPGFKTTAMAVLPGSSAVSIVSDAAIKSSAGWYRVKFFAHALHGYTNVLTVDVLDADGSVLAPAFSIALRAARNEWLHYDEFVPCNSPVTTKARFTVSSGGSTVQVTGLSIVWEDFDERALEAILWNVAGPAQAACPISSGGTTIECPNDFGEDTLTQRAFDNNDETNWLIAAEVPAGSGQYPPMALELEFDSAALVCGVRVVFDDANYPRSWRVLAKEGSGNSPAAWSTWMEAHQSGGSLQQFGVPCTQAHRLRLEIEDPAGGLFYKTYEIELLTPGSSEARCSCRHGGRCVDGGTRCECPIDLGCTSSSCGWAGPSCEQSACLASISCENLGFCNGPNTCRCQPGFYGTNGISQCTETRCGDGHTTAESSEECDDGNVVANDGCSASCKLEPLPSGFVRTLSESWMARSVPRDVLLVRAATVQSLAIELGVDVAQIRIVREDDQTIYYEFREYETICNVELCEISNTDKCVMQHGRPTCVCQEGYGGDKCETHLCSRVCAHGGRCIAAETCTDCAAGWGGKFCGTTVAQPSKVVAKVLSYCVIALLSAAQIIVVIRRQWIPIRARGAASLLGSYMGGIAWVISALATVDAEDYNYDSGQSEPVGLMGAWIPFLGFGLWLTASVTHLRAMVKIHIFHEVPVAFFPHMCFVGLIPWAGAALFERGLIATIMCIIALLYVFTHLAQVWQLRDDMDVVESSFATILGAGCMLFGRLAAFRTLDPQLALLYPIATACVLLVHFLAGSGRLLWYAVFNHRDVELLKEYHNDYAPVRGTFRESMLSFDMQVQAQRAAVPVALRDNSFRGRIGRTKFGQAAAQPLRSSGRFIKKKLAPREGGSFRRAQGSFSNSFRRAKESRAGVQLSRTSFDRSQFGARKKLSKKTQQRMGAGRYDPEVGEWGDVERKTTTADRGAAWRESAASRVEKQKGPGAPSGTKVAFATPQKESNVGGRIVAGAELMTPARGGAAGERRQRVSHLPGELPPLPTSLAPSDGQGGYRRKHRSPTKAQQRQSP